MLQAGVAYILLAVDGNPIHEIQLFHMMSRFNDRCIEDVKGAIENEKTRNN